MSKRIDRFEDFIAWQKARKLTADIYKITSRGNFARDFGLKDQIRRAAVSSMSNWLKDLNVIGQQSFTSFFRWQKGHVLSCERSCTWLLMLDI
jgi:four helix bundle protein